jgi:phenylpropionate dioxygenase-like ring-hydroxylating dioxygenase large terminal subunit
LSISETMFPQLDKNDLPITPLSQRFYTSDEWFEKDMERVFRKRWLFVCHVTAIPKVGDYTTYQIGNDSVIVVRGKAEQIHAFHNTCAHRGAELCEHGTGNTQVFVCPYHAWSYNLDGSLRLAPQMHGIDKSATSAHKVWCEVWNGFVFINMSKDQPTTVADHLSSADFSGHKLEGLKVIESREYLIDVNWKVIGENQQECYHCSLVHSNTLAKIIDAGTNNDAYSQADVDVPNSSDYVIFSPDLMSGSFLPGNVSQTKTGQYVNRRLFADGSQSPKLLSWFPNFILAAFSDFGFIQDWIPMSANKTLYRSAWFVHKDSQEGIDYIKDEVVEMLEEVNQEDKALYEKLQRGVMSSGYVPGRYNPAMEAETRQYLRQYISMISGPTSL